MAKKGLRLLTNYVIKNLYQQMLFFLVPLYAFSATWSMTSLNWIVPVVILVFAVLSTMDLVFDNVVMEHRIIASLMYGVCMFGVLNLIMPMVFQWDHFLSLLVAAGATAPAVALLSFRLRAVFAPLGLIITVAAAGGMIAFAWYGRRVIPPAPTAVAFAAVGHGQPGQFECVPGRKRQLRADRLAGLRCAADLVSPAGIRDDIIHIWKIGGDVLARVPAQLMTQCDGEVFLSELPPASLPKHPEGRWRCTIETADGQLLGDVKFTVAKGPESEKKKPTAGAPKPESKRPEPPKTEPATVDAAPVD